MNRQTERDQFIATLTRELPELAPHLAADLARTLMRASTTLQRIVELECSSEWHCNHDLVRCPGEKREADCLCDQYPTPGTHQKIPRITLQGKRIEQRLIKLLAEYKIVPVFQGDPRGCVFKLRMPSGHTNDWGREGVCVP